MYYAASKELVNTEIAKRSEGISISTGITTTTNTTAAVGATAKSSMESLPSMSVSEEEIDRVTSLINCPQSLARNETRYLLLLPLIYKQFHYNRYRNTDLYDVLQIDTTTSKLHIQCL